MKYSLVRNGVVDNVIEIDDPDDFEAPKGYQLVEGGEMGYSYDGTAFAAPPPADTPTATTYDVNAERERRIAMGTTVAVDGIGDVPVTGRPEDQITMLGLKSTARDMDAAGTTDAVLPFRDGANETHMMTPQQMIAMVNAAAAYVTAVYQASWDIKAMDPLPADVTDDGLWP